jgi:hypothetical protein
VITVNPSYIFSIIHIISTPLYFYFVIMSFWIGAILINFSYHGCVRHDIWYHVLCGFKKDYNLN